MVFGVRHTDHGAHIVLAKRMEEVGEILPLVMGVRGAAIGTLCARAAETVMVLVYAIFRNKVVRIRLKDMVKIDKVLLKDFAVYSMPVVLNELMWGLGTSANTAVIGHLGSAAVAANSVAQVARQLATVVTFGISHATAIYLGKTIGDDKTSDQTLP